MEISAFQEPKIIFSDFVHEVNQVLTMSLKESLSVLCSLDGHFLKKLFPVPGMQKSPFSLHVTHPNIFPL